MSSDIAYKVFSVLIFPVVLGALWWDAERADSKPSKEPVPKAKELLSMLFPLESFLFIVLFFIIGMTDYVSGLPSKIPFTIALPGIVIEMIYIFRKPEKRKVVTWHPILLFLLFLGLGGLWQVFFISKYPPANRLEAFAYLPVSAILLWLVSRFNPFVYFSRKHIEKKARSSKS